MMPTPLSWPMHVHICIPAYNAEKSLGELLSDLLKIAPASCISVVNDGSTDSTANVCQTASIECLTLPRNRGKGCALVKGMEAAILKGATWVLTLDADGQHSPNDIPLFLDAIQHNPTKGIILGARKRSFTTMPFFRICSNALTAFIISLYTKVPMLDVQTGYRAYNAALLKSISLVYERFEMETEVILMACGCGYGVFFVPIQTIYASEKSNISHVSDTLRWVLAVLSTTRKIKKHHVLKT